MPEPRGGVLGCRPPLMGMTRTLAFVMFPLLLEAELGSRTCLAVHSLLQGSKEHREEAIYIPFLY